MTNATAMPVPVHDPGQIDLDRHCVIEASAGTGKTYTIEHLVVQLLKSKKVDGLDTILAVTFTEKAAGELKDRIRKNIEKSIEEEQSEILQTALDTFDSASIFTIHGFCNKILQEYAFENGGQFQYELTDDRVIYRKVLSAMMREEWPARYGHRLREILEISRFPGATVNGTSSWMEQVIDIAMRYQPAGSDILDPPGGTDIMRHMTGTVTALHSRLDALLALVGPIAAPDPAGSELCARYASLNIRKQSIPKRLRILSSLLALLADHQERPATLQRVLEFLSDKDIASIEFSELAGGWNKPGADYEEKLPRLPDIITLLEGLRSVGLPVLQNLLAADAVRELKAGADRYKESQGLISYDDMVVRVHAALAADSGALKRVLQGRYRYALVDEFQDTDMLQWKIFSMIFLESGTNRLFIIGDPKQAIYGFRGADIHAYYTARDEMIAHHGARYYCLDENWRSSPSLIRSFNCIFAAGNWFSDSAITYQPSRFPAQKDPGLHAGNSSLVLVWCGISSGSEAKFKFADFIARELTAIRSGDPSMALKDVAVLVTKWKEAEAVETALKEADIKYSFYKKEGLYQTRESLELSYLLAAIAQPHDVTARKRALVTRFFSIPLALLNHYDEIGADHPVSVLFSRWIDWASMKRWPRLFQSLLDDTGIQYRLAPEDYDRAIINYRSILQNLEIETYRNNFSAQEMRDHLNGLRTGNASSHENYNIQNIDIDRPGVQILTVHASKGLEFKTVFIAGGFTRGASPGYWTYHRDGRKTFDLVMDPRHQEPYLNEAAGENERLFYVALTRARDRLYLPFFEPRPRALASSGILGTRIPETLKLLNDAQGVVRTDCESTAHRFSHEPVQDTVAAPIVLPDHRLPDASLQFLNRTLHIDSFSGLKEKLHHRNAPVKPYAQFGEPVFHSGLDDAASAALVAPGIRQEPAGELPRSRETGLLLHQVLERVDFRQVGAAVAPDQLLHAYPAIASLIDRAALDHLKLSGGEELASVREASARIVWHTLHAPLGGTGLALGQLEQRLHEVEFHYPLLLPPAPAVPGTSFSDSFIHGFIDMIFMFQEKIYIVDWKSNYIERGYSRDLLEQNILEMRYDLQISIYTAAVILWLKRALPDYSYDRHFGGVFYLYLRGMNAGAPGSGIYFTRPADEDEAMSAPVLHGLR